MASVFYIVIQYSLLLDMATMIVLDIPARSVRISDHVSKPFLDIPREFLSEYHSACRREFQTMCRLKNTHEYQTNIKT